MKKLKAVVAVLAVFLAACGKNNKNTNQVFVEKVETTEQTTVALQAATTQTETATTQKDPAREYIADGFSFGPISDSVEQRIVGVSYPKEGAKIKIDELYHVEILHYDFNGNIKQGELVVNKKLAKEITEIFYELYSEKYPIQSVKLVDEFNADDEKSMAANNTSCFNYRTVDNSKNLSKHAYGAAIDINPMLNPYVTKNGVSPANAKEYANRSKSFSGKIDKNDAAYKAFTKRGWTWGGDWKSVKDYQHFQKDV